jgi:hypothetical protein
MSSTDRTKHDETISDPAELSDRQLFSIPLRNLSKRISLTTSLSTTAKVYIRWLEVHRTRGSSFIGQWENTIRQWAQSLRARGFKEQDFINEVRAWKNQVGPLVPVKGRCPPGSRDIEKAYRDPTNQIKHTNIKGDSNWKREKTQDDFVLSYNDGIEQSCRAREESRYDSPHEKSKSSSKKKTLENYMGPPPPSYVCNRCGKKGIVLRLQSLN